jgi:hypothetical protein
MKKQKISIKQDRYRKARGGYSRLLNIFCDHCKHLLFLYQKDGRGPLQRLYLDRIIKPQRRSHKKALNCPSCQHMIGTYYIYAKEQRPAYRLYQDAVMKKIIPA